MDHKHAAWTGRVLALDKARGRDGLDDPTGITLPGPAATKRPLA